MRTLIKITVPVEAGNKALQDGSLPRILQSTLEKLKPEAAYFAPLDGKRAALFIVDLKETSDLPTITEPLFAAFNAEIEFSPVMNVQELQAGLAKLAKG